VKIVDNATGGWGHINIDDVNVQAKLQISTLTNHDFESGKIGSSYGWTVISGMAFSNAAITNETTYWGGSFDQQGTYHLWGFKNGDEATGVMQSNTFKIGGFGQIDFLISGGEDINNLYVALVRASDGKELFKATGSNTERYSRVIWYAADHIGEQVYVKIVDNATGGWGHINIDDVNVQAKFGTGQ